MPVRLRQFNTRSAASEALAGRIVEDLNQVLDQRAQASLVVSGGSSPVEVFARLSQSAIDWRKVTALPSDERLVPEDDPASNLSMIRRELAQGGAANVALLSLLPGPDLDLSPVEAKLSNLDQPYAHVMLGMGGDGHTASLFPDAPELDEALNVSSGTERRLMLMSPPSAAQRRITLLPAQLLSANAVSLLIFGDEKLAVLDQAQVPGPASELPVRCILHQDQVPVDIYWAP